MKHSLPLLIGLLFLTKSFSQITFEKGYFINNANIKTECLIKNEDWSKNPFLFEYKLDNHSGSISGKLASVKEFGIYQTSKYIRYEVKIDTSSQNIQNLSRNRLPQWKKKTVFLKVIVAGNANLYQFKSTDTNKFFYNKEGSPIEQLIFKKYKVTTSNNRNIGEQISENLRYLYQIHKDVNCNNKPMEAFKNLEYKAKPLAKQFSEHNICKGHLIEETENIITKKGNFNFKVNTGINIGSLSLFNGGGTPYDINFESKTNIKFSIEVAYIFPVNKNKWSMFAGIGFTSYKSHYEKEFQYGFNETSIGLMVADAQINTFDIPIGARYYLIANENSKFFINGGLISNFFIDSSVKFSPDPPGFAKPDIVDLIMDFNFMVGFGYLYKDKISVETRIESPKKINNNNYFDSSFRNLSLMIGYQFN